MKHIYLVILFLTAFVFRSFPQFNPELAEKSLVKVIVTGNKRLVCSGFIWKKMSWIVTSLHTMQPNGVIEVSYPGNVMTYGKAIKVFESADLVLIETDIDTKPPSGSRVPLSTYFPGKPQFGEKIYAIGYHGGSLGDQTQPLEKGHANPETLWYLVRPEDQANLASIGFPSMKIPIYFLTGSLLPGFSGSPVYNTRNELIGIGDGGLERGQMNVSWCIPANNLDQLEASQVTQFPEKLGESSLLYTAEVAIDVNEGNQQQSYQETAQEFQNMYKNYSYGQFDFNQTKTRTLKEMVSSAIDQDNIIGFAKEFNEQKIFFDYNSNEFDFDIYEDINNGFVIALPVGTTLSYDKELEMFDANLPDNDENAGYFNLFYGMETHDGDPVGEIIKGFSAAFGSKTNGMTRDPAYNRSHPLNNEWRADYFVLQGNGTYKLDEAAETEVLPNLFVSLISNDKEVFFSVALCFVPTDRPEILAAFQNGVDCINHYEGNSACCDYFGWFFHVIAASQLTTISSYQASR